MTDKWIKPDLLKSINISFFHASKSEVKLRFQVFNKLSVPTRERTEIKCMLSQNLKPRVYSWLNLRYYQKDVCYSRLMKE